MLTPTFLREHAGIDQEVVITGVGDCLELWDRAAWETYERRPDRASA